MNFRILHYKTLDSTNNRALKLAKEGAEEGTVICTEYQTKGRGRFKRRWGSPKGVGLLFSLILRPKFKTSSAPFLTHVAALSVREALTVRFGIQAKLKRPNDVLVQGKKIAGILTESSGSGSQIDYVILGIGLNVNTKPKDLLRTATSVLVETGKKTDKDALLLDILRLFSVQYLDLSRRMNPIEEELEEV